MASYNQTILLGNLTRKPEKKAAGNTTITNFTIAVSEKYKDRDDNVKEETNFFDCEAFGKKAELIADHHDKGDPIFISGKLKQNKWQDSDGNNRSRVVVRVEDFQFVGTKKKNISEDEPAETPRQSAPPQKKTQRTPW